MGWNHQLEKRYIIADQSCVRLALNCNWKSWKRTAICYAFFSVEMILGFCVIRYTPLKINMSPKKGPFQKEMLSSNNNFSWGMLVFGVVTSTIKSDYNDLASQTGYTDLPYLLNMLMGIQHPSPPVDWIWDIPNKNVALALEVLSIALLQMISLVEMFSSTRRGSEKFLFFFGTPWFPTDVFVGVMKWRMMWYWMVVFTL